MDAAELPVWAQQLGGIVFTVVVATISVWVERRKKKKEAPELEAEAGAATVVAAYFFDRSLVQSLISEMGALRHELAEMNQHLEAEGQARHDEKVAREAAARALLEVRLANPA